MKLCVHCEHCRNGENDKKICNHESALIFRDLVAGKDVYESCYNMRSQFMAPKCGENAKLFKNINTMRLQRQ